MNPELKKVEFKDMYIFVKLMTRSYIVQKNEYNGFITNKNGWKKCFKSLMNHHNEYFYKIIIDNKIAGFICINCYLYNDLIDNTEHNFEFDKFTIWYNLFYNYHNKGVGSKVVPLILNHYNEESPIYAKVKKDNIVSCKLLIKNDFKFHSENSHSLYYVLNKSNI